MAVLLGGLCQLTAIVLLATAGIEVWRVACLGAAFVGFIAIEHRFIRAIERISDIEAACGRTIAVAQLAQVGCMAVTGGLASPYLVSAILPAVMPLVLFGPVAISRGNLVLSIALMVALASLPEAITGPSVAQQVFAWVSVAAYSSVLILVYDTIQRLARATKSSQALVESLRLRQLTAVEKRTRTLKSFREGLEDELKNPLAVVKALVQLVARNPNCDRTEERLGLVQGEVARIERTIGEYLTFQRAMDSLDLVEVDIETIVSNAVESVRLRARGANVAFDLVLRHVSARADVDMLTDALIEMLSRAISGTPLGGVIAIATFPSGSDAVIKVGLTSARGQAPAVPRLDSTFAALVVAQHGGDVVSVPESERSVTITLTLPQVPTPRDRPRWRVD